MQTVRLIYTSTANPAMQMNDLISIGEVAAANNKLRGMTGFLCYSDAKFMQAVEGTATVVNRLLQRLYDDRRHSDLHIISFGSIDQRVFPTWSMRSVNWDEAWPAARREYLIRQFGLDAYEPRNMSATRALAFLEVLAEIVRRRDHREELLNHTV